MLKKGKVLLPVALAAVLWFWMFSPWTSGTVPFWLAMTFSALVLAGLAVALTPDFRDILKGFNLCRVVVGIVLAFALWCVFRLGDRISSALFDFARPEVEAVYSLKEGFPSWAIALLLLFVIGPAEEFFWRGYVQRTLSGVLQTRFPKDLAFLLTLLVYSLIHVWSGNFMLVMAAFTAGAVWGFVYRLKPEWLPSLVVSHAVWDALVFVLLPI